MTKNDAVAQRKEELIQWLDKRIAKANTGDSSAMSDVRQILDEMPKLELALGGDLNRSAVEALLAAIAPKQPVRQEAIHRRLNAMAAELLGDEPTPVEKICVQRICMAWLHALHLDCLYAQADNCRPSEPEYLVRMQCRANQRLFLAIKTLCAVRKLASPVQVNVSVDASVTHESAQSEIPAALLRRTAMFN